MLSELVMSYTIHTCMNLTMSYLSLCGAICQILTCSLLPCLPSVEAIYPIQNPNALQDQRVSSLIQYAMKVEKAMFETASSREEYYQLLVEKIYCIRKELEERRKLKMEMDKRQPMAMEGVCLGPVAQW